MDSSCSVTAVVVLVAYSCLAVLVDSAVDQRIACSAALEHCLAVAAIQITPFIRVDINYVHLFLGQTMIKNGNYLIMRLLLHHKWLYIRSAWHSIALRWHWWMWH